MKMCIVLVALVLTSLVNSGQMSSLLSMDEIDLLIDSEIDNILTSISIPSDRYVSYKNQLLSSISVTRNLVASVQDRNGTSQHCLVQVVRNSIFEIAKARTLVTITPPTPTALEMERRQQLIGQIPTIIMNRVKEIVKMNNITNATTWELEATHIAPVTVNFIENFNIHGDCINDTAVLHAENLFPDRYLKTRQTSPSMSRDRKTIGSSSTPWTSINMSTIGSSTTTLSTTSTAENNAVSLPQSMALFEFSSILIFFINQA